MAKFLGRQSVLWSICLNIWLIWGVCWLLVSPVYAAWEAGYTHRKKGTFGTVDGGPHTHFPVLIDISDGDIDDNCDDDGTGSWDIMFTTSNGISDLDIDWIDYSEAGGNALITCYVSQAGWAINDGTEFYIYYENAGAGDPNTQEGVWDASYKGIWHLDEANGTFFDTTANDHDSSSETISNYRQTGKIHWAPYFDGTDDFIQIDDHADWDITDVSISCWVNITAYTAGDMAWSFSNDNDAYRLTLVNSDFTTYWRNSGEASVNTEADDNLSTGAWYHVVVKRISNTTELWINGVEQADSDTMANEINPANSVDFFQNEWNGARPEGYLEEVRFATAGRADEWTQFEFDNVNEGDGEITWGSEESESASYIPKVIIFAGHGCMGLCLVVFRRKKKK